MGQWKMIFTSDLHGEIRAFLQFSKLLSRPDFRLGVISGDLQDGILQKEEVASLLRLAPQETERLPKQLSLENDQGVGSRDYLHLALEEQERRLRKILSGCDKPVLVVRGNHDKTAWESEGNVQNIGQSRVDLFGYGFVGYEFTEFEKTPDEQDKDMPLLAKLMQGKTILVSHAPPKGVLDIFRVHDSTQGDKAAHIGSQALASLKRSVPPSLHLFGHVHDSFGILGNCVNGSYSPVLRKMISIEKQSKGFVIKTIE
jgi:Icc-related predicted phosphoesterase